MKKIYFLFSLSIGFSCCLAQNTWKRKADFGAGNRSIGVAFSIGNKGYVGLGQVAMSVYKQDFWEWNQATNIWTQKANYPGGTRGSAVGFSVNNKGYVGLTGNATKGYQDLYEYDPSTNNWTQKANFPGDGRYGAAYFSIGTKCYAGMGSPGKPPFYNDFWEWEQSTNTWSQKANFPGTVRTAPVSFSIGNKGYAGAGGDGGTGFYKDFWEWEQSTNTWTQKADFAGNPRLGAVSFTIGNKGYIGTGQGVGAINTKDFWEYNPATDKWTRKADFPGTARTGAIGFSICNKGYIGMGWDVSSTKDFWEYSPDSIIIITGDTLVCSNDSATLLASGASSYLWSTGATTPSIKVKPSGNSPYWVKTFSGTCSDSASVTLHTLAVPAITITGDTVICKGDSANLTAAGGGNYSWNTGATTASITVAPNTTTTYTATATNANGCSATASKTVIVNSSLTAKITGDTLVCNNDSATLIASSASSYLWSTGATTPTIKVKPTNNSSYDVKVFSGNCSGSASVIVKTTSPPIVTLTGDTVICQGSTTKLTAAGGEKYLWNTKETTSVITVNPQSNEMYTVVVSIGSCSDSNNINVVVLPSPAMTHSPNISINAGDTITLTANATGVISYLWNTKETNATITVHPTNTTLYFVTVTDTNNCSLTDSIIITVKESACEIVIPNIFSPNNDEANDVFYVQGNCIKTVSFAIYNRWGRKIFETSNGNEKWNGIVTQSGVEAPDGVYYYILDAEDYASHKKQYKGFVVLNR